MLDVLKYCKRPKSLTSFVNYYVLDDKGSRLLDKKMTTCFSHIFSKMPLDTSKIVVWYHKENFAYDDLHIGLWVDLLHDIGFPVKLTIEKEVYYFTLDLKEDFKTRFSWKSALSLIRLLCENVAFLTDKPYYIIPDKYFQLLDILPNEDKLYLLQLAYTYVSIDAQYAHLGHSIRDLTPSPFLLRKELTELLVDDTQLDVYTPVHAGWKFMSNPIWQDVPDQPKERLDFIIEKTKKQI